MNRSIDRVLVALTICVVGVTTYLVSPGIGQAASLAAVHEAAPNATVAGFDQDGYYEQVLAEDGTTLLQFVSYAGDEKKFVYTVPETASVTQLVYAPNAAFLLVESGTDSWIVQWSRASGLASVVEQFAQVGPEKAIQRVPGDPASDILASCGQQVEGLRAKPDGRVSVVVSYFVNNRGNLAGCPKGRYERHWIVTIPSGSKAVRVKGWGGDVLLDGSSLYANSSEVVANGYGYVNLKTGSYSRWSAFDDSNSTSLRDVLPLDKGFAFITTTRKEGQQHGPYALWRASSARLRSARKVANLRWQDRPQLLASCLGHLALEERGVLRLFGPHGREESTGVPAQYRVDKVRCVGANLLVTTRARPKLGVSPALLVLDLN